MPAAFSSMWHTRDFTHSYRKIFNRAWELKSMLGTIKIPWIMISASLRCALHQNEMRICISYCRKCRCDEEEMLLRALNIPQFDAIIRGSSRMHGLDIEVHRLLQSTLHLAFFNTSPPLCRPSPIPVLSMFILHDRSVQLMVFLWSRSLLR